MVALPCPPRCLNAAAACACLQVARQADRIRTFESAYMVEEQRRTNAVNMRQEVEAKWHRVRLLHAQPSVADPSGCSTMAMARVVVLILRIV